MPGACSVPRSLTGVNQRSSAFDSCYHRALEASSLNNVPDSQSQCAKVNVVLLLRCLKFRLSCRSINVYLFYFELSIFFLFYFLLSCFLLTLAYLKNLSFQFPFLCDLLLPHKLNIIFQVYLVSLEVYIKVSYRDLTV